MRTEIGVSSRELQEELLRQEGGRDLSATKWHALDNLSKTRLKDYSSEVWRH
jgi:ABC-type molybdenum transport system ATPase subunit/photorepair protein PhrA